MKKLVISALALTLVSFASVQAECLSNPNEGTALSHVTSVQDRVEVKPADLPEGIKSVIKSDDFKGWEVANAFLVTAADKTQYYELNVKRGKESARVKLDKNGNNVD